MTQRQFIHGVWKFNALAIAGVLVLGGIMGLNGVFETVRHILRDRSVQTLAHVPTSNGENDSLANGSGEVISVGQFSRIRGHSVFWAPVSGTQNYRLNVYNKRAHSTRNYAFYNAATGESRRLLKTDHTVVSSARPMVADFDDSKKAVAAILYEVIRKDSDKDGSFTIKDLRDLVFSKADGRGVVTVVYGVDTLHGHSLLDSNTMLVIYSQKGQMMAEHFNVNEFKSIKRIPMYRRQSADLQ